MASALGLGKVDVEDIMAYAPHSPPAQRVEMLRKWRRKLGSAATYKRLANAFSQCYRKDLVEEVTKLIMTEQVTPTETASGELELLRYLMCVAPGITYQLKLKS